MAQDNLTNANPTLKINDDYIFYIPASLTFQLGEPTITSITSKGGAGIVRRSISKNYSDSIGKVSFSLANDQLGMAKANELVQLTGQDQEFTISIINQDGTTIIFTGCCVTEDYKYTDEIDTKIEIVIEGDRGVLS